MSVGWGDTQDVAQAAADKLRQEVAPTGCTRGAPARFRSTSTEPASSSRRSSAPVARRGRRAAVGGTLAKLDDKIDELTLRLEEARQELHRAEERVQTAPDIDARTLADWIAAGERGKRPDATLYERQRERDAASLTIEARQRTLDEALEERLGYVEKHREAMLRDARADVEAARDRLRRHVEQLPALRQDLLDARDLLSWTAIYPDEPEAFGFSTALALGLQEPVKRTLETKARIEFGRVIAALEADADALADRHGDKVQRALGTAPPAHPSPKPCGTRTRSTRRGSGRS